MILNRRVEALERELVTEPTILTMPDGSTETIPGQGDYLLRLYTAAISRKTENPQHAAHLDLIRRSTGSMEPGGGRMVDLIRCFQRGPAKESSGG